MGEYQENSDFEDLLDTDSDDDDEGKKDNDKDSDDNLLSLDDVTITDNATASKVSSGKLDLMFFPDMMDDKDEDEDDDEELSAEQREKQSAKQDEEQRLELEKKKKLQKRLHSIPPGIDLFRQNSKQENVFKYFCLESLNLETDFNYSRRPKLLGHGFTNARLDEMFSDRFEFVRHLFPEAQTVLICDQADFKAIMNFLFFSISVCLDESLTELMTKAFFDLRKNYGFKWNLTLGHVLTCLLNYGADEEAVYNPRFFQKHLDKHLEAVRRSGQKGPKRYELPPLAEFVKTRRAVDTGDLACTVAVAEAEFRRSLVTFVQLVTDFSAGQPSHLEFRYRDNWSDQIILIYILMITATDKRIISNIRVREAVMLGIHYHLDSFSGSQWYWGPDKEDQPKTLDGLRDFNHSNVCKSLIILLNEFFPGELCRRTVCWEVVEDHEMKVSFRKSNASDHHLNLLHRLSLIPPSHRGNQLKKYLAFMCLQTVAETMYVTPTHVDVFDLIEIPELCDELSPGLRLLVKAKNYEVLMTVVEFYDIIVGHEPSIDFTEDKVEAIERISKNVLQWMEKKLPSMNNIRLDNPKELKGIQLSEYLSIVLSRWQSHCKSVT